MNLTSFKRSPVLKELTSSTCSVEKAVCIEEKARFFMKTSSIVIGNMYGSKNHTAIRKAC
jgi:hypothetical protein